MRRIFSVLLVIILFTACETQNYEPQDRSEFNELLEVRAINFKLDGLLGQRNLEISGLTWYKGNLVVLPQYPFKFGDGTTGSLFFIKKRDLLNQIHTGFNSPLSYKKITLEAFGLERFNSVGSGYEAVTFIGDTAYFTIESFSLSQTNGYIVRGIINNEKNKIFLNSSTLKKIAADISLENMAQETLTSFNNELITIFEANGRLVNGNPYANIFSSDLENSYKIKMPAIEYRITDATKLQQDSTFWVINYMWGGDLNELRPADDEIFYKYGVGISQKNIYSVERLLKMKLSNNEIVFAKQSPIYLELEKEGKSRNWEGIVQLDNYGFILATDKFPETLLSFIPFSNN